MCYIAVILVVYTLELTFDDVRAWCLVALVFIIEFLAYNQGTHDATDYFLSLPTLSILKIKEFMTSVENGEEKTEEELLDIMNSRNKDDKNE